MVLPLSLLRIAQSRPIMVELKNGETYSGLLVSCDTFMNLHLREAICTSRTGDRFWRIPECYVRGNTVKYLRLEEEVVDLVRDEVKKVDQREKRPGRSRGRGGRGGGRGI